MVEITALNNIQLNLFPKTTEEEIIQNIRVLLTTMLGTVTLDRKLGLDTRFIDDPLPKGLEKAKIFILETIQEYEPRVYLDSITFDSNNIQNGMIIPKVKVVIKNEYA